MAMKIAIVMMQPTPVQNMRRRRLQGSMVKTVGIVPMAKTVLMTAATSCCSKADNPTPARMTVP